MASEHRVEADPSLRISVDPNAYKSQFFLAGVEPEEQWRLEASEDLATWREVARFELSDEGLWQASQEYRPNEARYFRASRPISSTEALDKARLLWASQGPKDYEYALQSQFSFFAGSAVLTVRGNKVTGVTEEKGDFFEEQDSKTVEQWFAYIEKAIRDKAAVVRVSYDRQLGYPRSLFIDRSLLIADEERWMNIMSLTPLQPVVTISEAEKPNEVEKQKNVAVEEAVQEGG